MRNTKTPIPHQPLRTRVKAAVTHSPEETARLAREFAARLRRGDVVAFLGDLGSGKTFFIQEICKALGCREYVTSPSFTILQEYHTADNVPIYHFDFYRLTHPAELLHLGLDDFFYGDGITLIEWADKIPRELPVPRWEIQLKFVNHQPTQRRIYIYRLEAGHD